MIKRKVRRNLFARWVGLFNEHWFQDTGLAKLGIRRLQWQGFARSRYFYKLGEKGLSALSMAPW